MSGRLSMNLISSLNQELLQQNVYNQSRIQEIYRFPADMQKAEIHKRATTFGYNPKIMSNKRKPPLCPCCQLPFNTIKIPIDYGTTPSSEKVKKGQNVYLLNSGTSMFFTFIKMVIIYLLLRFILTDMYNLISSMTGSYCQNPFNDCSASLANLSAYNKNTSQDEEKVHVVDILNLITIFASVAFFILYRKYQFKIYSIAESTSFSQDDYTLFVQNIPVYIPEQKQGSQVLTYQDHIKKAFEKKLDQWIQKVIRTQGKDNRLQKDFYLLAKAKNFKNKPKVRSISLCFDLTQMEKIAALRQKLMEQHIANVLSKIDVPESSSPLFLPNQIKVLNNQYSDLSKLFAMDESSSFNLSHFVGRGYVSFEYQHYCEFLMRQYSSNSDLVQINQKSLDLSVASQPSDVYWFNMTIDNDIRLKSIFKSYLVLIMSLTFSFIALLKLQLIQLNQSIQTIDTDNNVQVVQNLVLSFIFTIAMTILINIINYILTVAIQTLTDSEKHKSKTQQITSLMLKNIIAQFFNTAIIYYILSMITNIQPLNQNGIVIKIMSLVAVSGVVNMLMNALQIGSLVTCLVNKWKYRNKEQVDLFQIQLNKKIQDPDFDFAQRYGYYIMQVYVVSFYASIAPSITIILALIFVAQYWIDKLNLFYRSSCPIDFNFQLSRLTFKIFQASILIFAIGNLIFMPKIHASDETSSHILNWIGFAVAFIYVAFAIFLPKKWQQKLFYYESVVEQSYTDCLKNGAFNKVYWLSNPATSFAKQKDVNNPKKFVEYHSTKQQIIASKKDFQDFQKYQNRESIIEKYGDKDESVVKKLWGLVAQEADLKQLQK